MLWKAPLLFGMALCVSGCAALGAVGTVTSTAIGVGGAVVGTTGQVVGAGIGAVGNAVTPKPIDPVQ